MINETKDAYLESIMDYMDKDNVGTSSNVKQTPIGNENYLDDYLLQINHDEPDSSIIRQSLQRMQ